MVPWRAYQEEAAEFFRGLGLQADTNTTLVGARGSHRVDVVVRSIHVGFNLLWIVECKRWKSRVSQVHVLALLEIVKDLGADRGLLMAEVGVQRGVREATQNTNVQITSIAELRKTGAHEIGLASLKALLRRVEQCRETYWRFSKLERIRFGLRPEPGVYGYSTTRVLSVAQDLLHRALLGRFPPTPTEPMSEIVATELAINFYAANPQELFASLDPHIKEVERNLAALAGGATPS